MDKIDEQLLDMIKGNARMTYQEMGDALGMTRMAAKKRVKKLEDAGIIRGYNTTIHRKDEVTIMIDIVTIPESFEKVLEYVSTRTAFIRQIYILETIEKNYQTNMFDSCIKIGNKVCYNTNICELRSVNG